MSDGVVFAEAKKGYNKEQVNRYLEELNRRCAELLGEKDREIARLKDELERSNQSIREIRTECEGMKADKEKIASVLIDAQARAEQIITNAKQSAEEEKERMIREADDKRNLVVERNRILRDMRIDVSGMVDEMKKTMNASHEQILRKIEEDLQKFMEDSQAVSERYSTAMPETFAPETFAPETFAPETFTPETFAPENVAPESIEQERKEPLTQHILPNYEENGEN